MGKYLDPAESVEPIPPGDHPSLAKYPPDELGDPCPDWGSAGPVSSAAVLCR
jgi:hypothetical protein